jgi:hypothetical protein
MDWAERAEGSAIMIITEQPMPKSKRGAYRQYRALLRAYKRAFDGGGAFGWDWPTLRLNSPETYTKIEALRAVYTQLPE